MSVIRKFLVVLTLLFCSVAVSQSNLLMPSGNNNGLGFRYGNCNYIFTDSGGAGNYSNGENGLVIFTPMVAADRVQINFESLDIRNFDILTIYDGESTSAPILVTLTNTSVNPGSFIASSTNTSGAITISFTSNGTLTGNGWSANISCVDPCQSIITTTSSTPSADAEKIIRVCQNAAVNFMGSAIFGVDGSNATYNWDFGDGSPLQSGLNVSHAYNTSGIYNVDFIVSDGTSCVDRISKDFIVFVSTNPNFSSTSVSRNEICLGDTVDITGGVRSTPFGIPVSPPVAGTTFLPDGNGSVYRTCIDVNLFPADQRFVSASDLESILVNIEHSYLGDLRIFLTAPNGATVNLHSFSGLGFDNFLGIPIDDESDLSPGIGFDYLFRAGASNTFRQAAANFRTLPAGDYLPEQSFGNFINSPLNGQWCITVIDNLQEDNGYIFNWGLNFSPSIIPNNLYFTPEILSTGWRTNPDIIATSGQNITVQPTTIGQKCYTYEVMDDFGCTYTREVCIDVFDAPVINDPMAIEACETSTGSTDNIDLSPTIAQIIGAQTNLVTTFYQTAANAENRVNPIGNTVTFFEDSLLYVRVENPLLDCASFTTLQLNFNEIPKPILEEQYNVCLDANGNLLSAAVIDTGLDLATYSFEWRLDGVTITGATNPIYNAVVEGNYEVIVTNRAAGCVNNAQTTVRRRGVPNSYTIDVVTNPFSFTHQVVLTVQGPDEYWYRLDNGPYMNQTVFENVSPGLHTVTIAERLGCAEITEEVFVYGYPDYFTPNGDGYHDTWNIIGGNLLPETQLYIFDRYGKLLKQLNPSGVGWDGTFNGQPVPSSDYWFKVIYNVDGKSGEAKGHFSLKR